MFKKTLIAATAAIATVASAAAQTMGGTNTPNTNNDVWSFECVVVKVTPPSKDRDPGYKVNITINSDGQFTDVTHTTVSGAVYDRADQYKDLRTGRLENNGPNVWFGKSKKYPELSMIGSFGIINKTGEAVYDEAVFKGNAKKPHTTIHTTCHQFQA